VLVERGLELALVDGAAAGALVVELALGVQRSLTGVLELLSSERTTLGAILLRLLVRRALTVDLDLCDSALRRLTSPSMTRRGDPPLLNSWIENARLAMLVLVTGFFSATPIDVSGGAAVRISGPMLNASDTNVSNRRRRRRQRNGTCRFTAASEARRSCLSSVNAFAWLIVIPL
jgi:hypothetical protein